MKIQLLWHNYKYFPYEKELAIKEVRRLLNPQLIVASEKELTIEGSHFDEELLQKLVYFRAYSCEGSATPTFQQRLESTCVKTGHHKKQSTRYSVHGLHEYKGKFNPQIVRGILNILDVDNNTTVLDPFCGSGTTLVECAHADIKAMGFDMNPLAVFLSNTKLQALSTEPQQLGHSLENIIDMFNRSIPAYKHIEIDNLRFEYLAKWFAEPYLSEIECLRTCIQSLPLNHQSIFFVLASNLLRDYSLQEPSDLRVRRRRSPMPSRSFIEAFREKASTFLKNHSAIHDVLGELPHNEAFLCGNQHLSTYWQQKDTQTLFDVAITSPPYATALPYIETQRLSLIWMNLCAPNELKQIEVDLTGSREMLGKDKLTWRQRLKNNHDEITEQPYNLCIELSNALTEQDGFRRQAVPALMYRYFYNMRAMFEQVKLLVKKNAPFALVVGHNHTTLGGKNFDIDTPSHLKALAESCGWSHMESYPLQTYQRYDIHKANSVKLETLLILKS